MALVDIAIVIVLILSTGIGFLRGFVKEAISILALVVAAWVALRYASLGTNAIDSVIGFGPVQGSQAAQLWLGRALVFFAVLLIGGLIGWLIAYIVNKSGLSGTDRMLGMVFGFFRGALVLGVVALAGNYLEFSKDDWWQKGRLVPYVEKMGAAVHLMAPKALEYLRNAAPEKPEDPPVADGDVVEAV